MLRLAGECAGGEWIGECAREGVRMSACMGKRMTMSVRERE